MNSKFSKLTRAVKNLSSKSTFNVKRLTTWRPSFTSIVLFVFVLGIFGGGGYAVFSWCPSFDVVACFIGSYGRGVGEPMGCGPDEELNGALCYPKCEAGYKGEGPVCWQEEACPDGFTDTGLHCLKPEAYGRGAGYVLWDESKCESENGSCEKCLALYYPTCKPGFHAVGCNICSPDCPNGMNDIGVSCEKKSYGRTAGVPLHTCPEGQEQSGLLCYPVCKRGFKGEGPVCWEEN